MCLTSFSKTFNLYCKDTDNLKKARLRKNQDMKQKECQMVRWFNKRKYALSMISFSEEPFHILKYFPSSYLNIWDWVL